MNNYCFKSKKLSETHSYLCACLLGDDFFSVMSRDRSIKTCCQ